MRIRFVQIDFSIKPNTNIHRTTNITDNTVPTILMDSILKDLPMDWVAVTKAVLGKTKENLNES